VSRQRLHLDGRQCGNFNYSTVVTKHGASTATERRRHIALTGKRDAQRRQPSRPRDRERDDNHHLFRRHTHEQRGRDTDDPVTANSAGTATATASVTATESDPNSANNSSRQRRITGSTLIVITNADSGTGSLRQAILDANAGVCLNPCTIAFHLPGAQLTVRALSALPAVAART